MRKPPLRAASYVAPTGRAGVRAMKGPVSWPGRREAPIRCGYARAYDADRVREAKTHPSLTRHVQDGRLDGPAPIEQTSRGRPRTGSAALSTGMKSGATQDVVHGDLDRP